MKSCTKNALRLAVIAFHVTGSVYYSVALHLLLRGH